MKGMTLPQTLLIPVSLINKETDACIASKCNQGRLRLKVCLYNHVLKCDNFLWNLIKHCVSIMLHISCYLKMVYVTMRIRSRLTVVAKPLYYDHMCNLSD